MSQHSLTPAQLEEVWNAYVAADFNTRRAAHDMGIPRETFRNRLNRAKLAGLHLSQGARTVVDRARLSPTEAKGGWIHDYDAEGKKIGTT